MYFLRKLKDFRVDSTILRLFYTSVVESVVVFGIVVWYKALSSNDLKKMERVRKTAQRIIGLPVDGYETLYKHRLFSKVETILKDCSHPLHDHYKLLPSGKRLRSVACKTKRHLTSFVPCSVSLCNDNTDILNVLKLVM